MDARAKLRRLVDVEACATTYRPTYGQAVRVYNILNSCIFGDKLKKPHIVIRGMRDSWALCEGDLYTGEDRFIHDPICHRIILADQFPSRKFFVEVLAHEMVHQYQCEHLNRMDHGQTFWAWENKLNRYNLRLFKAKSASRWNH